jgi:hypothetical protein
LAIWLTRVLLLYSGPIDGGREQRRKNKQLSAVVHNSKLIGMDDQFVAVTKPIPTTEVTSLNNDLSFQLSSSMPLFSPQSA